MVCGNPTYRLNFRLRARAVPTFATVEKNINIGKRIKAKMEELRIRPMDLIADMKIAKQSFYNQIRRPTIDTGMLQRFSEKMGYNFFLDFISKDELAEYAKTESVDLKRFKGVVSENEKLKREFNDLKTELESLKNDHITLLKAALTEKKEKTDNVIRKRYSNSPRHLEAGKTAV